MIRAILQEKDAARMILARDEWFCPDMPIEVGDVIHYIGDFGPGWSNMCLVRSLFLLKKRNKQDGVGIVDRDHGFLVINPDKLIRVTSIGDAVSCLRRSVLSEKLKVWSCVWLFLFWFCLMQKQIYEDAAEMIMGPSFSSMCLFF